MNTFKQAFVDIKIQFELEIQKLRMEMNNNNKSRWNEEWNESRKEVKEKEKINSEMTNYKMLKKKVSNENLLRGIDQSEKIKLSWKNK